MRAEVGAVSIQHARLAVLTAKDDQLAAEILHGLYTARRYLIAEGYAKPAVGIRRDRVLLHDAHCLAISRSRGRARPGRRKLDLGLAPVMTSPQSLRKSAPRRRTRAAAPSSNTGYRAQTRAMRADQRKSRPKADCQRE